MIDELKPLKYPANIPQGKFLGIPYDDIISIDTSKTKFPRGQRAKLGLYEDCAIPQEVIDEVLKPFMNRRIEMKCEYCKDWTTEELPIKSNADISRVGGLIALGDRQKEIVFHVKGVAYGIEINFCPMCGRKLTEEK